MEAQWNCPTDVRPSLSVGVVELSRRRREGRRTDDQRRGAMYASKRGGKNRVTGVDGPADGPPSRHRAATGAHAGRPA